MKYIVWKETNYIKFRQTNGFSYWGNHFANEWSSYSINLDKETFGPSMFLLIFVGPRSDYSLRMSQTHSLTH